MKNNIALIILLIRANIPLLDIIMNESPTYVQRSDNIPVIYINLQNSNLGKPIS